MADAIMLWGCCEADCEEELDPCEGCDIVTPSNIVCVDCESPPYGLDHLAGKYEMAEGANGMRLTGGVGYTGPYLGSFYYKPNAYPDWYGDYYIYRDFHLADSSRGYVFYKAIFLSNDMSQYEET